MAKTPGVPECSHRSAEKFLVARGKPGKFTGLLVCRKCITDSDLKPYGSKARAFVNCTDLTWTEGHQDWDTSMKTDKGVIAV